MLLVEEVRESWRRTQDQTSRTSGPTDFNRVNTSQKRSDEREGTGIKMGNKIKFKN